jgi:outer membrane protein assembly factor BamB
VVQNGSNENGLYALSAEGTEQWFHPFQLGYHRIRGLAVADDGTVYLAGHLGEDLVQAVGPGGALQWAHSSQPESFEVTTSIAVTQDGTLVVGAITCVDPPLTQSPAGEVVTLGPSGTPGWSADTEYIPLGGMAVDPDGAVYVYTQGNCDNTSGPQPPAKLLGLNPDGTPRLSVELDPPFWTWFASGHWDFPSIAVVLAAGGRIYVGSRQGRLHIINP